MIEQLFEQGKIVKNLYPIRLLYLPCKEIVTTHHKVLFSVSKKKIKRAVDRNAIKRKMKEAYRLHKHLLPIPHDSSIHFLLAYIYISRCRSINFKTIHAQIVKSMNELAKVYEK